MTRRRETPRKRTNPSGKDVWKAQYTTKDGQRKSAGTFKLKREAQDAIDAAYEAEERGPIKITTLGSYFETWPLHYPRSERSNRTNTQRIKAILDVEVEGRKLRDWPYADLRRRHATALVDHMLRVQGRAYTGAKSILLSLSAMTEDAITDEVALINAWKGVSIRPNDPRIQKATRPVRVWSWEESHAFAAACGASPIPHRATYGEPMVRTLADCGLRIGELLGLRRQDLNVADRLLEVRQTADQWGRLLPGTKEDRLRQVTESVGRDVPVPPALLAMLVAMPKRIDSPMLFPARKGGVWGYKTWREWIWDAGQERSGMDPRPHEFRHSFVSLMLAAGVNDADLAAITGHTVLTMHGRYTHSLGRSFEDVRQAVGG